MCSTRASAAVALVVLALSGCTHARDAEDSDPPRAEERVETGTVSVAEPPASTEIHAPYLLGNRVHALRGSERAERLAGRINTTFLGTLSPPALVDPADGRRLVYSSFRRGAPAIRVRDIANDEERVLEDGAYSLAWRSDGALAYFKARRAQVTEIRRYVGHVVVRPALDAAPVRWTQESRRYVVAAWADERLLAYVIRGRSFPDLLVFDGPGRVRTLVRRSALVALSPDAAYAFVAEYAASPPIVRVLALDDGDEVARLVLEGDTAKGITFVLESGSWVGETVFAAVTYGVAAFHVRPPEIALEQLLTFDTTEFPVGPLEPRADEQGKRILLWAELQARPREAVPPVAVLECDRGELSCVRVARGPSFPGARIVYNPSRPVAP